MENIKNTYTKLLKSNIIKVSLIIIGISLIYLLGYKLGHIIGKILYWFNQ